MGCAMGISWPVKQGMRVAMPARARGMRFKEGMVASVDTESKPSRAAGSVTCQTCSGLHGLCKSRAVTGLSGYVYNRAFDLLSFIRTMPVETSP